MVGKFGQPENVMVHKEEPGNDTEKGQWTLEISEERSVVQSKHNSVNAAKGWP